MPSRTKRPTSGVKLGATARAKAMRPSATKSNSTLVRPMIVDSRSAEWERVPCQCSQPNKKQNPGARATTNSSSPTNRRHCVDLATSFSFSEVVFRARPWVGLAPCSETVVPTFRWNYVHERGRLLRGITNSRHCERETTKTLKV